MDVVGAVLRRSFRVSGISLSPDGSEIMKSAEDGVTADARDEVAKQTAGLTL